MTDTPAERCSALVRHTDINGDDMVPCGQRLPCSWHPGETEAEMDASLAERIAAALADLDQTRDAAHSHYRGCWQHHADCLAARIRTTLTTEEPR